jgi:hypothetical protein
MNINIPVMGTADSIPLGLIDEPFQIANRVSRRVADYEHRLKRTIIGELWLTLAEKHTDEVRDLVNHDRHTKVLWQRIQGPAFFAHCMKSARDPLHEIPVEISGMRIENALLAMVSTLRERGSPELAVAVSDHYLTVLELVRDCRRVEVFVERVCAYAERESNKEASHAV